LLALGLAALAVVWLGLWFSGTSPWEAGMAIGRSSMGGARAWTGTLREWTPLLLTGLAVFVALRAGLFNIGVEGQLIVGALCAAETAIHVAGVAGLILAILAGIGGGALYALAPGWIRAYRGGYEVITTIMLNWTAVIVTTWLIGNPLKKAGAGSPVTPDIAPGTEVPLLLSGRLTVSWILPLAVFMFLVVCWWLTRTVNGFEFRLVGANPRAAEFAGLTTKRVMLATMVISGAIAGLTGALLVLGYEHNFSPAISASYGFVALGVALLAGTAPIALLFTAFLFAMLSQGALGLQDHAPKGLIGVLSGLVLIVFAAWRYRRLPEHE
jgi:ABC-type uncharacterized transport system permease subunit